MSKSKYTCGQRYLAASKGGHPSDYSQEDIAAGLYRRHYDPRLLPAIPIRVGYMPASTSQPYPSAYWYVASRYLLWSFWQRWDNMTIERA